VETRPVMPHWVDSRPWARVTPGIAEFEQRLATRDAQVGQRVRDRERAGELVCSPSETVCREMPATGASGSFAWRSRRFILRVVRYGFRVVRRAVRRVSR